MLTIWQHGKDEPAGGISDYLAERGEPFEILRLDITRIVPANLPERLIILGGQMSVNDTAEYPFFSREQEIIRNMVDRNRPVLGICLGAQMIAAAFGERIYRSASPERGWCRISGCHTAWQNLFPPDFFVFHWHNETFNLPKGSTLIAKGDIVENQVFRIGSALGVQFHPEVTPSIINCWSEGLPNEESDRIKNRTRVHMDKNTLRCNALIDAFMRGWT